MTEEQYIEVREINRKLMIAVDLINKLQADVKNLNISGYEDEILEFFKKQREKYETKMEEYVCAPGSRWIYDHDESLVCERCRHSCPMDADGMYLTDSRYCPHCGAKMI